jgi:hypothetical protein
MVQNIIVWVIVLIAIFFTFRRLYRLLSNKKVKCGCAADEDCSACPVQDEFKEDVSGSSSDSTPGL